MSYIIDGVLLVLIITFAFLGFNFGLLKIGSITVGMYLGLVIAALFYKIFGSLTAKPNDADSLLTNQIVWFTALWVFWSIVFSLVILSFTRHLLMPKWFNNIDQLGGVTLGLFAGVFVTLIIGFAIKNGVTIAWFSSGSPDNYLGTIATGFDNSILIKIFRSVKFVYTAVITPIIPGGGTSPVFADDLAAVRNCQAKVGC